MYCRMCGNKLDNTDQYCQKCGAPTVASEASATSAENKEIKEEVVFNPPYESTSPFVGGDEQPEENAPAPEVPAEDLGGFISERELEEANRQQDDGNAPEVSEAQTGEKTPEFTWNVHEFPGAKKRTDNTDFNWNMEEFGQPEPQPQEAEGFERELFREIREDAARIKEQNIDRFFTFSRKNEEFQELLDREYEKIKTRAVPGMMPQVELHIDAIVPLEALHSEETMDTEVPAAVGEELIAPAAEEPIPEAEAEIEEPAASAVETIEPQQEIIEPQPEIIDLKEEAAEPQQVAAEPAEPEITKSAELEITKLAEPEITEPVVPEKEAAPKAEHLTEMAQARALFFGEELVRDNDSIIKKLSPEQEAAAAAPAAGPIEIEAAKDVHAESEEELQGTTAFVPWEELAEIAQEEKQEPERVFIPLTEAQKTQAKNKITGGQIALVVIAVILAAEIGILGIRYFAPESAASASIENAQTKVIRTVAGWFETKKKEPDQTKEEVNKDNNDQTTNEESTPQDQTGTQEPADTPSVPAADPNPMTDKNALVASQLGYNTNIEQVKANDALAWQSGKNYGLSDINGSVPITNNILQAPETGDPVYYDKSIVGAVIAFDSQWIDYVNTGNKGVLDLLKKDSDAYKKTLSYKKVGKIKEAFKLLEIGEIRQGSSGYYVWVHEEIQITENGTTTNKKYNWIYCLEPVDGKMKIVNYLKF